MKRLFLTAAFISFTSGVQAKDAEAQLGIESVSMSDLHEDNTLDATVTLGGHSCAGEQGSVTITLKVPNVRGPAEARERVKPKVQQLLHGLQDDVRHCEK